MGPMSGPLFDAHLIVDWSASSTPKRGADSIWSCVCRTGSSPEPPVNHPTRAAALAHLVDLLVAHPTDRVLVGIDMPYGYPAGFAASAGLTGTAPWWRTWCHLAEAITDAPDNANNRFDVAAAWNAAVSDGPGPFWGTTSERHVRPSLSRTKAPGFPHRGLAEHRHAELDVTRRTGLHPFSVWQLAGAGSVGSQTLVGIPVLHALRTHPDLRERSVVWPFECGFTDDPTAGRPNAVVHAEIWPSSLGRPDPALHPVKDAGQVIALARRLAELDAAGDLADRFAPALDPAIVGDVLDEEGWILDVT